MTLPPKAPNERFDPASTAGRHVRATLSAAADQTGPRPDPGAPDPRPDPRAVHDHLLEVTRQAIMADDADRFLRCFRLPQTVRMRNGTRRIISSADMIDVFRQTRDRLLAVGATDLVRVSIAASFIDEDTIRATHVSYVMRDRMLLTEPYQNTGLLRRVRGIWLVASSEYGRADPGQAKAHARLNPAVARAISPNSTGAPDEKENR